ncbi:MAG: MBL fold metallo-hydrolase [Candidatus Theseobacter exili]|nr:MBL fold metallo-hydrolase [Candidatus Theseobacter exili]
MLSIMQVGYLATNCYMYGDEESGKLVLIDPGTDNPDLVKWVENSGYKLSAVINTHGHYDHTLGNHLLESYFNVPVMLHPKDHFFMSIDWDNIAPWLETQFVPPQRTTELSPERKINIGKISLGIIHTPGHSPGSVCLIDEKNGILFSGDTLFADGGVGRTDLPKGSAVELKKSLRNLAELSPDLRVLPGHGAESILGVEIRNIFG